jgi:hypothetical protein
MYVISTLNILNEVNISKLKSVIKIIWSKSLGKKLLFFLKQKVEMTCPCVSTDETQYVTTTQYVTNCYIPYREWQRHSVAFWLRFVTILSQTVP